jgi:hypothetical protein
MVVTNVCLVSAEAVCGWLRVVIELPDRRVGFRGAAGGLCCFRRRAV